MYLDVRVDRALSGDKERRTHTTASEFDPSTTQRCLTRLRGPTSKRPRAGLNSIAPGDMCITVATWTEKCRGGGRAGHGVGPLFSRKVNICVGSTVIVGQKRAEA